MPDPITIPPALIPYLPLIILAVATPVCFVATYRNKDIFNRLALSVIPILAAALACHPRIWTAVGVSGTLICLVGLSMAHLTAKRYADRPAPTSDTIKVLSFLLSLVTIIAGIFSLVAVVDQTIWAAGQPWPSTIEGIVRAWLFTTALITFTPLGMVALRGILDDEDKTSLRIIPMAASLGISALAALIIVMIITIAARFAL